MDNDLLTLWCRAALLTETETRALITDLQAARDATRADISDLELEHEKALQDVEADADAEAAIADAELSTMTAERDGAVAKLDATYQALTAITQDISK